MKENIFTINQRLQRVEINSKQAKAELLILFDVVGSGKTCDCGSGESNYHKKIGCRECC